MGPQKFTLSRQRRDTCRCRLRGLIRLGLCDWNCSTNRAKQMCFSYDDDYAEVLQSKTVKCREPQNCEGCREIIQAGEYAKYTSEKCYAFFCCETCQRTILSIAAEEIRHGCSWSEAWCHPSDIRSYLRNRGEPLTMLEGSLDECKRQINELWTQRLTNSHHPRLANA